MKKISADEVRHMAWLAKLNLSQKEVELFQKQLSQTLTYIETISLLDKKTARLKETHQVSKLANVWREDEIDTARRFTQSQALSNAKSSYKGYFIVKAVLPDFIEPGK